MDQASQRSGERFQFRLLDLIVMVVGASYVLDVARRSKVAWGGGLPDLAHAYGLIVLTLGLTVGLVVVGRGMLREREGRRWSVLWRVLAVGWLAGSLVEVAAALQVAIPAGTLPAFGSTDTMRLRLTSLMTTFGMIGLVLAVAPIGPRPASRKPRVGSWLSVTLATLVGVVILSLSHGVIPYLILIAMEAVHNAMHRAPLVSRPALFDRMLAAGLESLPGLLGCLATASWVDDDLRAAARDPLEARAPRTWRGVVARASAVALAASGAAYFMLVSTPRFSPTLAEGLGALLTPSTMATIVLGFSALAAGLSARSAAYLAIGPTSLPADRPPALKWPRRIASWLIGLLCFEITAGAIQVVTHDLEYRWYIPISLSAWGDIIQAAVHWMGQPPGSYGWSSLVDRPDDFLIGGAAIWLTARLAALLMSRDPSRPSPLDALFADGLAFGRFLGWWIATTIAMVASLPILAVVGVTLTHYFILWTAR